MRVIVEMAPDGSLKLRVPDDEPVDFAEAQTKLDALRKQLGIGGARFDNPNQEIEQHQHGPEASHVHAGA